MTDQTTWSEEGFYFKVGDDFFGMHNSESGPKLFFNRDKYRLTQASWDVEIVVGRKMNWFIFYWEGETKVSFRFPKEERSMLKLYELLQEHQSSRSVR